MNTKAKTTSPKGISVKLFVGVLLTSEIKLHLQNSIEWKQAKIDQQIQQMNHEELVEIHHQDKEYLGLSIKNDQLSIQEFREIESSIRNKLKNYCPELNLKNLKILLFPQTLLF